MCPQARQHKAKNHTLGKTISELGELLAVSSLEEVDATLVKGLNAIEWDLKSESTSRVVAMGEYTVEIQVGSSLEKKPLRVASRFSGQGF